LEKPATDWGFSPSVSFELLNEYRQKGRIASRLKKGRGAKNGLILEKKMRRWGMTIFYKREHERREGHGKENIGCYG
jgi:hypothetical protein